MLEWWYGLTTEDKSIKITARQMAILTQVSLERYDQFKQIDIGMTGKESKGEVIVDTHSGQKFKLVVTEVKA